MPIFLPIGIPCIGLIWSKSGYGKFRYFGMNFFECLNFSSSKLNSGFYLETSSKKLKRFCTIIFFDRKQIFSQEINFENFLQFETLVYASSLSKRNKNNNIDSFEFYWNLKIFNEKKTHYKFDILLSHTVTFFLYMKKTGISYHRFPIYYIIEPSRPWI
jgi:hypothetical protein